MYQFLTISNDTIINCGSFERSRIKVVPILLNSILEFPYDVSYSIKWGIPNWDFSYILISCALCFYLNIYFFLNYWHVIFVKDIWFARKVEWLEWVL